MSGELVFLGGILAVASVLLVFVYGGPKKIKNALFGDANGIGIAKGIILFSLLGVLFVAVGLLVGCTTHKQPQQVSWFNYGMVYLGVDTTHGTSPQCVSGQYNDRITSHGGVRINILETYDKKAQLNTKYTHHSCAFDVDQNTYDAIGIELEYYFFRR